MEDYRLRAVYLRRMLFLIAMLIAAFFLSFTIGRYPIAFFDVLQILGARLLHLPITATWENTQEIALLQVRLPRILLSMLVGGALSAAGCAFQIVFQNPMAAPDILGASSGAGFGAALAILFGFSGFTITAFAFAMSVVTLWLVYLIGQKVHGSRTVALLLSGIMIGSLFSAGISYVKLVADPSDQLPAITYWLMGSLAGTKGTDVWMAFFPIAIGLGILYLLRWRMNLLLVSAQEAQSMGIAVERLRFVVLFAATLLTAASVAASGMIGWVGLLVPNLTRKRFGSNPRYLLPASTVSGAVFLLLTDTVSRNLLAVEIPIGILTAFLGAPFFLYLMTRKER